MNPFRWIRRIVLLLILAVVVSVGVVAFTVWWTARGDARPHSDAIVVLGASQFNGRPSTIFRARLLHAQKLYDAGVASRIIVIGGKQPGDSFTEGRAGVDYLQQHGVPGNALLPVGEGNDTLASLRATAAVFKQRGWHSAVLVTDPWHVLRSQTMARDLGIAAHSSPERAGPAVHSRGTEARYIVRETVAYIYYELFHTDHERGPGAV